RHIKNYLIPHSGNNNRPHLLREASVAVIAVIIVLIFGFSVFEATLIRRGGDFTAAVIPQILIELTNNERESEGLAQLTVNPTLEEAARMKAKHMAENEYFAHVSPDGLDPWYWFYRAGYTFTNAGENLAVNFVESEDVTEAWMDSPGHRANILDSGFTEIGIAAVAGEYKGKKTLYVVQMFGSPAIASIQDTVTIARVESEPEPAPAPLEAPAPEIAGDATEIRGIEMAVVAPDAEPEPESIFSDKDVTTEKPTILETVVAHPRALVEWVYLVAGLLISFVLLCMVWKQVHREHSRSVLYGVTLLVLIGLLGYLNMLLLSADLLII
ncbi:MAG: CAP domain-containing protein, partial [Patescibacteria group bacterium]